MKMEIYLKKNQKKYYNKSVLHEDLLSTKNYLEKLLNQKKKKILSLKKIFTMCICLILVTSLLLMSGCTGSGDNNSSITPPAVLKFGAGVYVGTPTTTDASADKDGSGKIDVTVAAVTVDANGKIVACALDTASNTVQYTADGKAVAVG